MSKTMFTPGPWLLNTTKKFIERLPNMLCVTDQKDRVICGVSHDLTEVSIDEYTANACLIQAAPDLLEYAVLQSIYEQNSFFIRNGVTFRGYGAEIELTRLRTEAIKKTTP